MCVCECFSLFVVEVQHSDMKKKSRKYHSSPLITLRFGGKLICK